MLQKIILSTLFLGIAEQNIHASNNDELTTLIAAVSASIVLCTGGLIIIDAINSEPNNSIINRAQKYIQEYSSLPDNPQLLASQKDVNDIPDSTINEQTIYSFTAEPSINEKKLLANQKHLQTIHNELDDRYNKFFTPWNWSNDIKDTITDIKKTLKKMDQSLCLYTLKRIEEFNHIFEKYISRTIVSLTTQDIASVLAKQAIKKGALNNFLQFVDIATKELSQRNLNALDSNNHEAAKKIQGNLKNLKEKANFLAIMQDNRSCILNMQTKDELIKTVKTWNWDSPYLLIDVVNHINHDINTLTSMNISSETYVKKSIHVLQQANNLLINSDEYKIERRAYDCYLEQKRQREAAEKIAAAAIHQANATQELADAEKLRAHAAMRQANAIQELANAEKLRAHAAMRQANATQELADAKKRKADATQELADAATRQANATQELANAEKLRAHAAMHQASATQELADTKKRKVDATQELANAIIRQANATQEIANARKREANAAEEKNIIEQERNKIEHIKQEQEQNNNL